MLPVPPTITATESTDQIATDLNNYLTGVNSAYDTQTQDLLAAENAQVTASNSAAATAAQSTAAPTFTSAWIPLLIIGGGLFFIFGKGKL